MDGGFSMSWKTGISILLTVGLVVAGWGSYVTSLATDKDLRSHEQHPETHEMRVSEDGPLTPIPDVIKDHEKCVRKLENKVETQGGAIITVKNGFFDYRAEELADRAADKVKNSKRSREVWKQVKAKALENLEKKRPIREGLENLLE